jgi:xanthine dehydrogenase YagR molybdenum-binding subunit
MTTITKSNQEQATGYVGRGVPRADGLAKATGTAKYTFDISLPEMAYGVIVSATIAHGRVVVVDATDALAMPGVLLVLSAENTAPTPSPKPKGKPYIWFDRDITYDGQDVAFVVAISEAVAQDAAQRVRVTYDETPHVATMRAAMQAGSPPAGAPGMPNVDDPGDAYDDPAEYTRGDVAAGLREAAATITTEYSLPNQIHHPLEAHVTVAQWEGAQVTVWDSVQWPLGARRTIATALGIPQEQVRVITEHVGGGFGSKLSTKSQAPLAALAARQLQRPVRARLLRSQMSRNARHRPATLHRMRFGADAEGKLTAMEHIMYSSGSPVSEYYEMGAWNTRYLYPCPNVISKYWRVRVNQDMPGAMRAPGDMQAQFALESALDELAHALNLDPIELRRRNHTDMHLLSGKPFTARRDLECLERGAELIGWRNRAHPPASRREGPLWYGIGCAVAHYPLWSAEAEAEVDVLPSGEVVVKSSAVDLGTGTYTILTQVAADAIGARLEDITTRLGDTDLPKAPIAGGSMIAANVSPAVHRAGQDARRQLIAAALAAPDSPFVGLHADDLDAAGGAVFVNTAPQRRIAFNDIVARTGTITGKGEWKQEDETYAAGNFGGHFAEVAVDVETGMVTVRRFVAVHDSGRVINAQTFRSQLFGGVIWGISNALLEESLMDERQGRIANANLWDYLIPTALDVGEITVESLDIPDFKANPLGLKSVGEVGITGVAPAIGNAIFNATGVRLHELPFKPHRVLTALRAAGVE